MSMDYPSLIVEKLKPLEPYRVILFGSYASGSRDESSDIDLIVVTQDKFLPKTFGKKMEVYMKVSEALNDIIAIVPIDLIVYTRPMYEQFLELDSMFCREVHQNGQVLYERSEPTMAE